MDKAALSAATCCHAPAPSHTRGPRAGVFGIRPAADQPVVRALRVPEIARDRRPGRRYAADLRGVVTRPGSRRSACRLGTRLAGAVWLPAGLTRSGFLD